MNIVFYYLYMTYLKETTIRNNSFYYIYEKL